jgi:energy-coupling factor transport system substrate-specific component
VTAARRSASALAVGRQARVVLVVASIASLVAFVWPLFIAPGPAAGAGIGHGADAPFVFVLVLPVLLAVMMSQLSAGGIDAKAIAMLGVLSAIGAALRPLGAGTAGIEAVFFLLVLAGRVFGPGFGFVLGSTTLFASGLLTGGVGPWLPFQMLAASWVGLGAGLLPQVRGKSEIVMLMVYTAAASIAFGLLMDLWFWPFVVTDDVALAYVAGAPLVENLRRLLLFSLVTSLAWDIGRAFTNVLLVGLVGSAVLATLRRASRRAAFGAPRAFAPAASGPGVRPDEPGGTLAQGSAPLS